jgi:hypothetical protein
VAQTIEPRALPWFTPPAFLFLRQDLVNFAQAGLKFLIFLLPLLKKLRFTGVHHHAWLNYVFVLEAFPLLWLLKTGVY